jgi:hypothetical protein
MTLGGIGRTAALLVVLTPALSAAATIGMVASDGVDAVTVFDADADVATGSVPVGTTGSLTGDCSITPDQGRGFVTTFGHEVWTIDTTVPALAGPPNPIPIANYGEDTALSPDGKFLLVCDGSAEEPVSVVDVATQVEIGTFPLGASCNSVDVCDDGSVLVTTYVPGAVRRLTIDGTGTLTDTGESFALPNAINVYCAPGSASGLVVVVGPKITSFTIPGLVAADAVVLPDAAISGAMNRAGTRVFIRHLSAVDAFTFVPATGALGAAPLFSIPVAGTNAFFGMEQMALHPNDTKLYVSEGPVVNVYDSASGAFLTSITDPSMSETTGICFANVHAECGNGTIEPGEACDDGTSNGTAASCCTTICQSVCNDHNACTDDHCDASSGTAICMHTDNTAPCSVADHCRLAGTCSGGTCQAGPPKSCDDSNPCTDDFCNSSTGGCFTIPNANPCDDGNPCTDGERCQLRFCGAGSFNTAPCDDGNACTGNDHCQSGVCNGAPISCDDHNPCTSDSCSRVSGCVHTPLDGISCQDDDPCTIDDRCQAGACTGDPRNCFDDDPCTVDSCSSAGGAFLCVHQDCNTVPNGSCPAQCRPAFCGNGRIDPGETCDPPDATPQPGRPGQVRCRPDCTSCGDAITQPTDGETCDDGSLVSGCNPHHAAVPLDPCQNGCTPPICEDRARFRTIHGMGVLDVHGRIEPVPPALRLDPFGNTFVVELTDDLTGAVIFRRSLDAGLIVRRGRGFRYVDRTAKVNGGIARLKVAPRGTSYRVTLQAYATLPGATAQMTTHIHLGAQEWTLRGQWVPTKNGWQLDPESALGS